MEMVGVDRVVPLGQPAGGDDQREGGGRHLLLQLLCLVAILKSRLSQTNRATPVSRLTCCQQT